MNVVVNICELWSQRVCKRSSSLWSELSDIVRWTFCSLNFTSLLLSSLPTPLFSSAFATLFSVLRPFNLLQSLFMVFPRYLCLQFCFVIQLEDLFFLGKVRLHGCARLLFLVAFFPSYLYFSYIIPDMFCFLLPLCLVFFLVFSEDVVLFIITSSL